jgi:hypothetical protein
MTDGVEHIDERIAKRIAQHTIDTLAAGVARGIASAFGEPPQPKEIIRYRILPVRAVLTAYWETESGKEQERGKIEITIQNPLGKPFEMSVSLEGLATGEPNRKHVIPVGPPPSAEKDPKGAEKDRDQTEGKKNSDPKEDLKVPIDFPDKKWLQKLRERNFTVVTLSVDINDVLPPKPGDGDSADGHRDDSADATKKLQPEWLVHLLDLPLPKVKRPGEDETDDGADARE